MLPIKSRPWSFLIFLYVMLMVASSVEPSNDRLKKHFSLFSVVQFNNEECTSDTSPAGGTTQGTCYTSTECTDKGGVQAGKCASGFGVCCVFINAVQANAAIMENRTRLRNEDFPAIDDAAADQAIVWTINKMQSDICQIRLDFTRFVIAGPTSTAENMAAQAATNCDVDTLQITTTAVNQVGDTSTGIMCGALTGEHLYVELSVTATDTATITLNTGVATQNAAAADRIWDIKVSQIQCFATYRAPEGCDRYIMDNVGSITSLNFMILNNGDGFNTGIELANQRVKTCIRRSKGMCCVQYQQCEAFNGIALGEINQQDAVTANTGYGSAANAQVISEAWSLDTNTNPYTVDTALANGAATAGITIDGVAAVIETVDSTIAAAAPVVAQQINIGMVDNQCSGDYVEIPSSWSGSCGSSHGSARNAINSRYCGARFGANFQAGLLTSTSTPVCDCSEPFVVRHNSDTVNDIGGTGGAINANIAANVGFAVGQNNVPGAGSTQARPRGFCLDFRQVPCWN